jgi:hypothetical protein
MDVGAELEWTLSTMSEVELRQQYRDLYTKLMMSARLGQGTQQITAHGLVS